MYYYLQLLQLGSRFFFCFLGGWGWCLPGVHRNINRMDGHFHIYGVLEGEGFGSVQDFGGFVKQRFVHCIMMVGEKITFSSKYRHQIRKTAMPSIAAATGAQLGGTARSEL